LIFLMADKAKCTLKTAYVKISYRKRRTKNSVNYYRRKRTTRRIGKDIVIRVEEGR